MLEEYDLSRSINLIALVSIIGSFEGLLIGLYLVLKKSVKFRANLWLGILILSLTAIILPGAIYRIGLLPDFPHVIHLHMVTLPLLGPAAYLYVRSCTQKDFAMRPILWLHFLPALLLLGYHLPFYFESGETKIIAFFKFFLEGELGIPKIISSIKLLHPVIYYIICTRLIMNYRNHLPNEASYIDTTFHRWLLVFCLILLLPTLVLFVFLISTYQFVSATTYFTGIFLFILAVHLAAIIKPELFQTFPHQMLIPASSELQKQKYENSNLQNPQKDKYIEKLQTYVATHKPFLEPELTLSQLSEQVKIPAHYLSQVINEKLDCSFIDFINEYRVKAAKEMLIDPKYHHYTILSTAYEAGFSAKSTFYTAFKKYTGMTPSAYRKQAKQVA